MRLRKAWAVRPDWADSPQIIFAETASKARYAMYLMLEDDTKITQIEVKRAARADQRLPEEHRLVAELTEEQRHIVRHAFGQDRNGNGYRDHYCTAPGDLNLLSLAWEFGLFTGPHGDREYDEISGWAGSFFYLTSLGIDVARSMLPTYSQR